LHKKEEQKMKKTYFSPENKIVELKLGATILVGSDITGESTGGGIGDDGSAGKSDDDTDPGDFGW
jgi:hypothetical protein